MSPSLPTPELSVIMVTVDKFETCRKTLGYLHKQTARKRLELIVVAPSLQGLEFNEHELSSFHSFQVVEIGKVESTGMGWAAGVRAAKSSVIVYAEEHSYPEPDWAEILIEAHKNPEFAAVGFAMANANPETLTSWAHLYGQFGPVVHPAVSGTMDALGGHHVSYKKEILLAYGEQLHEMLSNEGALHIDLRSKGYKLYLAANALSNHVNFSRLRSYCRNDYLGQRGFACARARAGQWSFFRKAIYIAATPVIPLVRLKRILGHINRTGRIRRLLPLGLFIIIPALVCGAVGEALGYLLGKAHKEHNERLSMELNRHAWLK